MGAAPSSSCRARLPPRHRSARGARDWRELLSAFYRPFTSDLKNAQDAKGPRDVEEVTDVACDRCGQPMIIKWGKNGKFLACSAYPGCKNAKGFVRRPDGTVEASQGEVLGEPCPECGNELLIRQGRRGRFIACRNYPACKYTKSVSSGFSCPEEGCTGDLVERMSKKKKRFHGCSRYPECSFATSSTPKEGTCPNCGAPVVFSFRGRTFCLRKDCGWKSR